MKIMWAFEPFHQSKSLTKKMHHFLSCISKDPKKIEVGYIVTGDAKFTTAFDVPISERFTKYPQTMINTELKRAGVKVDPKQIYCFRDLSLSTAKNVDNFLKLARERKSDLIALYTHSKKGINRLFLGSFAETAVHRSKTDLLVVSPNAKLGTKIRNVFLASDLSKEPKKEVGKSIQFCKDLNAKLTVFYGAQVFYKWALDDSSAEANQYREKTDKMIEWIKKTCEQKNVKCEIIVDVKLEKISKRALSYAKRHQADIIIVSAKTGPYAALMGGSITRQILRNSKLPVLVMKD